MSDPYVGEIRLVPYFAPNGWRDCDGALLPISDYDTLFSLIGTTYGGDGQSTFAVPDLRGRIPQHAGSGPGTNGETRPLGQPGGRETETLTTAHLPAHRHPMGVAGTRTTRRPGGALRASGGAYGAAARSSLTTTVTGNGAPHDNVPPVLVLRWIISLFGVYPSPS